MSNGQGTLLLAIILWYCCVLVGGIVCYHSEAGMSDALSILGQHTVTTNNITSVTQSPKSKYTHRHTCIHTDIHAYTHGGYIRRLMDYNAQMWPGDKLAGARLCEITVRKSLNTPEK